MTTKFDWDGLVTAPARSESELALMHKALAAAHRAEQAGLPDQAKTLGQFAANYLETALQWAKAEDGVREQAEALRRIADKREPEPAPERGWPYVAYALVQAGYLPNTVKQEAIAA